MLKSGSTNNTQRIHVFLYICLHVWLIYMVFMYSKYTVRPMGIRHLHQTSSLTTANIRVEARAAKVMSFILSCPKMVAEKFWEFYG